MQYMIIERYRPGKGKEVYGRFAEKGRMMPEEVQFINSWINKEMTVCYQVMESPSLEKLNEWIENRKDMVDFEVVPVISTEEAKIRYLTKGELPE